MAQTVDARSLPCPQPVIMTRRALRESDSVMVIVDNETARHNVTRMSERAGYRVRIEERDDGICLHITKEGTPLEEATSRPATVPVGGGGPLVLMVPSEFMGRGEHTELGTVLVRGFFHTLGEVDPIPDTIIFINSGVKLVVEDSPVLEDLQELCTRGAEVLACGTCLEYYELRERVGVGEVSNMYTIAETILRAGKVVNL